MLCTKGTAYLCQPRTFSPGSGFSNPRKRSVENFGALALVAASPALTYLLPHLSYAPSIIGSYTRSAPTTALLDKSWACGIRGRHSSLRCASSTRFAVCSVASLHRCRSWSHWPHTAEVILYVAVGEQIDASTKKVVTVGRQNLVRGKRCRYRVLIDLEDWEWWSTGKADCRVRRK